MKVTAVDPRDVRWEIDDPVFRVYFWSVNYSSPDPGIPDTYESMEYEVSGADIKEVLSWADDYARREEAERYTLYLRYDDRDGRGTVKLFGVDPTER